MTVAEFIKQHPKAGPILTAAHIDYCCGGKQPLEQACAKSGIRLEDLIKRVEDSEQLKESVPFNQLEKLSASELCTYIENNHHHYLNNFFPQILPLTEKLINRHGPENPYLYEIHELMIGAAEELSVHMKKEELILFPAIKKMEQAVEAKQHLDAMHFGSIANPITMMESDHSQEGERLEKLSKITNNFVPPPQACNTWKTVYQMLEEFRNDMLNHVFSENHILFPKAVHLEKQLN
ncbi:MAG: iron-sulfur cluster repair di-iron protein [Bacteroidia bacterium]|nr:iron-sulfur cluster repair di-iron protein [Bacteroidia bacterium]